MDLFDYEASRSARDAGINQVEKNSGKWSEVARSHFRKLPNKIEATGEDIKCWLLDGGLPPPHHYNAWGAFIMGLIKSNMLISTGRMVQMKLAKSHARRNPTYLINK